ncbi:sugar ABC transporter substrate-binding protein [Streptomyces sp. HNM0663]|uniref:Sugar ABC transporter substrate-binding protein n=1 Tax=Streptomyces chengmaiensis TaxID=3040919 RepID=A0ABT6HIG3_9ACTN|nr:sugar ABC transporter substrate-binding protein [Streptomyces chengmaiensis]MDH2388038.1 sugar ABC transporter substrate-binding protein [Streptomyces chengmaiensis]
MRTEPRTARPRLPAVLTAFIASAALLLSGCFAGAGGGGLADSGGNAVNVLMVNNPQMTDLQRLTKSHFTPQTGIEVHFTVLPENDVRDKISQEFANQAGVYDVASISNFEAPLYGKYGWLAPLDDTVAKDPSFDQADILEPIEEGLRGDDGKLYAEPFYGESSFLMYRKDVFAAKGLSVPERPTWQQVAALAAEADGAEPGMKGICLRGLPGWGEVFAPLTTVVNTYGGTWFTKDWQARVNGDGFTEAATMYVDLVRAHGEPGAAQAGFAECLSSFQQGRTAMWYDATSAAGLLEAEDSPVAGKVGYAMAPVHRTEASGWLYSWAWGIQAASERQEAAAAFVSWASGRQYEELVGEELGWARVPAGKRASTYANPEYQAAASSFYRIAEQSIVSADPRDPGLQPRPTVGIQFVDIPEFPDLATRVSQEIAAAIAGRTTVAAALDRGQDLAERVAAEYRTD